MFLFNYLCVWTAVVLRDAVKGHDKTAPEPTGYDLTLRTDFSDMTFHGEVVVGVRTTKDESKISLNSRGLDVTSVKVKWSGSMPVVESHTVDRRRERLDIEIDNLFAGNHTIDVSFKGKIDDRGVGLFTSVCPQNSNSWIAGASLQLFNARAVFPCFDLDENSTPLKLNVVLNQGLNIITPVPATTYESNAVQKTEMNLERIRLEELGWALYPEDEVIMKTESENGHSGISCRKNNWTTMTYDLAEQMSNYTGTELTGTRWIILPDFPFPFSSANNIIFIREHLFENFTFTSEMDLKENVLKINEAFAQQLFGGRIKASRWSHVWLTRGLANFMSYKLADMIDANFNSNSYVIGNVLPRVLEREAVPHSMTRHAHSKHDLLSMYDPDLFDRAGLTLRMIEEQVGENSFKRAIKHFVNRTIGSGTADPTQFWDSLKENSLNFPEGKTVEEVLNAWINSSGFPVVNARREKDYIYITQERILKENSKSIPGYWWIPITVTSQSQRGPRKFWLRPRGTLRVNLPLNDNWYMINENSKGFYRVNYDWENWKNLSNAISDDELKGMARARLLDDSLALAQSHHLHFPIALELTKHLAHEYKGCPRFLPWASSVRHLLAIRTLVKTSDKPFFDEYVAKLIKMYIFGGSVGEANSTSESEMKTMLAKLSQVKDLCRGNRYCFDIINFLTTACKDYIDTSNRMFDVIHCFNVEKDSSEKTLDDMIDLYKGHESATSEMKIIKSLSCLQDTRQKHRLLDMLVDDTSSFKRRDFVDVVRGMSYSEESADDVLNWMTDNKLKLNKYASGDTSMTSEVLTALSERIYDEHIRTKVKEIVAAFENRDEKEGDRLDGQQVHRAMFRIEKNIQRRNKRSEQIASWLRHPDRVDSFVAGVSNNTNIAFLTILSLIFIIYRYITV